MRCPALVVPLTRRSGRGRPARRGAGAHSARTIRDGPPPHPAHPTIAGRFALYGARQSAGPPERGALRGCLRATRPRGRPDAGPARALLNRSPAHRRASTSGGAAMAATDGAALAPSSTLSSLLATRLEQQGFLLLDGGLASELEARGHSLNDALWSARLLARQPEEVRAAHAAYFRAGADVAITASYQASFEGFMRVEGLTEAQAADAMARSVELARRAAADVCDAGARAADAAGDGRADAGAAAARPPGLVAASIGPYGAVLADGSEYTGAYSVPRAELLEFHARRIAALERARPDAYAVETQPNAEEVAVILEALEREAPRAECWVSFSCADGERLCDGTPVAVAAAAAAARPCVRAVGVNCVAPRHAGSLLARIASATDKPLVCYPNSGGAWDAAAKEWIDGTDADDAHLACHAREWYAAGARLIGGCCRTTPRTTRAMRASLTQQRR